MLTFRNKLKESDLAAIREIGSSTGFFDESDVTVSVNLAEKIFYDGDRSHEFILADYDGEPVAYLCYGALNDAAFGTYEVFWLSTHNKYRGCGIGHQIIDYLFNHLSQQGAKRLYLKTDSSAQYKPTRCFYESCGFHKEAELKGYYDEDDNCCIYVKLFNTQPQTQIPSYTTAAE